MSNKALSILEAALGKLPDAPVLDIPDTNGYDSVKYLMEKVRGDRLPNGLKPLKNLTARHRAILQLHMLGIKGVDIAAHFGVRETLISRVINDPLGKEYLTMKAKLDDARFGALYGNAVDVVRDGMDPKETMTNRLRAANIYMERKDKLDDKHGKKDESAEDVIQRILEDPTVIANLNLTQINNFGPAPLLEPTQIIDQESDDGER